MPTASGESIHAAEAVGRTLEPSANVLSRTLTKLEQKISIHPAMKKSFEALYAYCSDEGGIRHAILEGQAKVDETDALFLLGSHEWSYLDLSRHNLLQKNE